MIAKFIVVCALLSSAALAQGDMKAEIGKVQLKPFTRRIENKNEREEYRSKGYQDLTLDFPLTVTTAESRAFPLTLCAEICCEKKDGSRFWKTAGEYEVGAPGRKIRTRPTPYAANISDEINSSELVGQFKAQAKFTRVSGKVIAWRVYALSTVRSPHPTAAFNTVQLLSASQAWNDTSKGSIEHNVTLVDLKRLENNAARLAKK